MQFTVGPKKKRNIPIYFYTNYRAEKKLVPIIMDYCLLQFDALKFFLGVRLLGGFLSNFNFFNVNTQIFQRNRKVRLTNCLETNFHNISFFLSSFLLSSIIHKKKVLDSRKFLTSGFRWIYMF